PRSSTACPRDRRRSCSEPLPGSVGKSGALILKIVGGVALSGVIVGGIVWLLGERDSDDSESVVGEAREVQLPDLESPDLVPPEPKPSVPESPDPDSRAPDPQAPDPEPTPPPPADTPEPAPQAKPKPKSKAKPEPVESETASKGLAEELALMQKLSTALKAGDSAEVLDLVAEHRRDFPHGQFIEERSAAEARALCKTGSSKGAKKAAQFEARWPNSIHGQALRADCGLPDK
ncbi:MAG: hypothetical protein HC927_12405, partial [Deltaproteobacteria bacterium]|nr:hypothetical protein [Deltaproteobacteria bacterium]